MIGVGNYLIATPSELGNYKIVDIGYGPDGLVSPLAHVLRHAVDTRGVRLAEFLRVRDGRYWSLLCQDPDCCSPGGTAFTLPDAPGVLASRDVLAATLAPADGKTAESMRAATARAARMTRRAAAGEDLDAAAGAITRYGKGDRELTCDEAARITVALRNPRVRDDAWCRMDPALRKDHLQLWTDLTRLARPGYVAAPASLLAFTAWQCGNGALANEALDRALADNPQYRMAQLLRIAIDSGFPPSRARRLTPPELDNG